MSTYTSFSITFKAKSKKRMYLHTLSRRNDKTSSKYWMNLTVRYYLIHDWSAYLPDKQSCKFCHG